MSGQKLVMPYTECIIIGGYKVKPYVNRYGFSHYGVDLFSWWGSDKEERGKVRASGSGTVIASGWDSNVGNVVVIVYDDVYIRKSKRVQDIAARYYHLDEIKVRVGQTVNAGDLIGIEGDTMATGYHCHIEMDTDTDYPTWSPQVGPGGQITKKGIDSTINPSDVFYIAEGQTVKMAPSANKPGQNKWTLDWNSDSDRKIPKLENSSPKICPTCGRKL